MKIKDPDARLQAYHDITKNAGEECAEYYKDKVGDCCSKRSQKAQTAITKLQCWCFDHVAYEIQDKIANNTASAENAQGIVDYCCSSYAAIANVACEEPPACGFYIFEQY